MRPHTVFLAASGAAVAAAIAAGAFVIGGPGQARLRHLDGERIQSLERIAGAVDAYHRQRHALPPDLKAAADQEGVFPASTLRDPETGQPYLYAPTGADSYRLCAVFAARSEDDVEVRWTHGKGPVCFARTVGAGDDSPVVSVPPVKARP